MYVWFMYALRQNVDESLRLASHLSFLPQPHKYLGSQVCASMSVFLFKTVSTSVLSEVVGRSIV